MTQLYERIGLICFNQLLTLELVVLIMVLRGSEEHALAASAWRDPTPNILQESHIALWSYCNGDIAKLALSIYFNSLRVRAPKHNKV